MTAAASAAATDLPAVEHTLRGPNTFFEGGKSTNALGLLQNAVLPSFGLHGGLSIIAYGIARGTNRVEIKDYLWPSGMVLNAWWTAVGRHALRGTGASPIDVFKSLSYSQKLLLGSVTAWGARLFYRIVKRSLSRGKDDARYEKVKYQPGFWNKASLLFGLEAVFQTAISLPFTLPFRIDSVSGFTGAPLEWAGTIRWTAAAIFATGLTLETVADWQLDSHKKQEVKAQEQGKQNGELLRTGVWSVVRHPNYFGDFLVHLAFPLWNYGSQLFSWMQLLGPAANYFFLRYIGGDRENEATQVERYAKEDRSKHAQLELYQIQKHSFWPSVFEIANPWSWAISGVGAAAAAATYLYESRIAAAVAATNPANAVVGETLAGLQ
ncbi:hypothetical protein Slin15195_G087350 [Septoria linicola]|uniref:Steroid 5-alpha reductase C-terminal domain-containing protein n=1 Tax=Septoria linicola TaxID=215465 RepID=A0A9Q9B178_9PEZI|nr:hypothetical protein Slin14017_G089940 [Septoria linicola]USW55416.1 hypothetical protein Slin15195_G087350 [Septoria linicola]